MIILFLFCHPKMSPKSNGMDLVHFHCHNRAAAAISHLSIRHCFEPNLNLSSSGVRFRSLTREFSWLPQITPKKSPNSKWTSPMFWLVS